MKIRCAKTQDAKDIRKNKELEMSELSCSTRYPILLVHGTGFRDGETFYNYWGRIPASLADRGARVSYGRQDAWGTIRENALILKETLLRLLRETKSEKVNIIAHSKGGLEARYMISTLGMGSRVASLTTISTPHHGSKTIDLICKIPRPFIAFTALFVDLWFRILGDKKSDFTNALYEFRTSACDEFNQRNPDCATILYQSYAAKMKNALSDPMFAFSYLIIKMIEGDSDGMVSVPSAEWGTFRGVIENTKNRGVSHSDTVDLWRMNLSGFDIRETYVGIVEDLKKKGF